jgi:hypothetical protein
MQEWTTESSEFRLGETGVVPLGHDTWVVGNETFVGVDFPGAKSFEKK